VLFSSVWNFVMTTFRVIGYLLLGYLLFGIRMHAGGWAGAVLILPLAIASFVGIGVLSAAFILYFKRGDPIQFFLVAVSGLLGGVFYPPEVMPSWLAALSELLPITHALRGIRACLLQGSTPFEVWPEIRALLLFVLILVPLGLAAFALALRKARDEGSLVSY
jgi:ABC-2 type transport system permease protein